MAKEHVDALTYLRDHIVEDRRSLVASILADPKTINDSIGDFIGLQQFIDAVERAIGHEHTLDRPPSVWPTKPKGAIRTS